MAILTLLIALLLSLAAVAWAAWPLLKPGPPAVIVEDDKLVELLGRKDAVVAAIKDLEFDYNVGKLSTDDYERYDQRLRRQAVGLMQQIEQIAPESVSLDSALEAQIVARRMIHAEAPGINAAAKGNGAGMPTEVVDSPPIAAATAASASSQGISPVVSATDAGGAKYCTQCGTRLEPSYRFCAACGQPVART